MPRQRAAVAVVVVLSACTQAARAEKPLAVVGHLSQQGQPSAHTGDGYIPEGESISPFDNANPAISNLIRENKSYRIDGTIQTSAKDGMILLDDWLYKLYKDSIIDFEHMMMYAKDQGFLQRKVQEDGTGPK